MGRFSKLSRLFTGTPAPVPPVQLGPYASEAEAEKAAREADMRFAAWLDARGGFMEVVRQDDGWVVVRRGSAKPSWLRVGP